jgi:hypothetical protein
MYEVHNLNTGAMIAEVAYRRSVLIGTGHRVAPRGRWWRRRDLRTSSTHGTH